MSLVEIKEYQATYNIKESKEQSLPWPRRLDGRKIIIYCPTFSVSLFFVKADLAEKHMFSVSLREKR